MRSKDESLRLHLTVGPECAAKFPAVKEIAGLETHQEVCRYLIARGLEAMTPQLRQRELFQRIGDDALPEMVRQLTQQDT